MNSKELYRLSQNLQHAAKELDIANCASRSSQPCVAKEDPYDLVVKDPTLRRKTKQLFHDGHHARAVEEAFKLIDNIVQDKTGIQDSGFSLMTRALSPKQAILSLNEGRTRSERNEQEGYMHIFAGCMQGIRNPRAHETDWEDSEESALELLGLANHLIQRIKRSSAYRNPTNANAAEKTGSITEEKTGRND